MAREVGLLNARKVETLSKLGRHADGGNLYLSISGNGGKRWVFFYRFKGSRREMGLGSAAKGQVSLAEARKAASDARSMLKHGVDPLDAKVARKQAERVIPSFGIFGDEYLATHRSKFRNAQHIAQWERTLKHYCQPIRSLAVKEVDTESVLKVLQPIWTKIPETAARVRGRIESILDAAKAKGLRSGENPAQWRGHLKTLLPARQRLDRVHHAALPYHGLPAFITDLRAIESMPALALEICVLSAARSGEVLNAKWTELNLDKAIWTIPAFRMKAGFEHRIPLTNRAITILRSLHKLPDNEHVFAGSAKGRPLSSKVMRMVLKSMGRDEITVHGFRSTFRDWASEQTSFPHETCEHALAHRISDKAEASYRRGDQFEKRRKLMEAWASYCEGSARVKVLQIKRKP